MAGPGERAPNAPDVGAIETPRGYITPVEVHPTMDVGPGRPVTILLTPKCTAGEVAGYAADLIGVTDTDRIALARQGELLDDDAPVAENAWEGEKFLLCRRPPG